MMVKSVSKDDIYNKNIAFYFNYALGSPPLELHISTIKDMLSRGNSITAYLCTGALRSCTANPLKSYSVCLFCRYRAHDALKDVKQVVDVKYVDLSDCDQRVEPAVMESLELGVMSSMASAVKAQTPEQLNTKWKKYHDNMLFSAKALYNYFCDEIGEYKYDYLFMFNGRFGDVKPALEAARFAVIGYGLYEVKKSLHEVVYVNELVHSIDANTRKAITAYICNHDLAKSNAERFFGKKTRNEDTGDPVYTKNQQKGVLPDEIVGSNKIIVAVYPTTDDEYKFIGKEWDGFVPEDQVDEIDKIAQSLDSDTYTIVVKMHPNQATTAEDVRGRYLVLQDKYSHVIVEDPLSKKDTYALMHRADFVVNFASTIGVEACYARKIVIAIGDTTFSRMNIGYKTKSGYEAANLINKGNLRPKPIRGAIIWGNYLSEYADTLPAYQRIENGDYLVDGRKIGHSKILRILQLPAKLRLEMSKPGFKFDLSFIHKTKDVMNNVLKGKWEVK